MKRKIALFLALLSLTVFLIAACGSGDSSPAAPENNSGDSSPATSKNSLYDELQGVWRNRGSNQSTYYKFHDNLCGWAVYWTLGGQDLDASQLDELQYIGKDDPFTIDGTKITVKYSDGSGQIVFEASYVNGKLQITQLEDDGTRKVFEKVK